jgi:hypothetical protein
VNAADGIAELVAAFLAGTPGVEVEVRRFGAERLLGATGGAGA